MAEELIYSIEFLGTDKSIDAISKLDKEITDLSSSVEALRARQQAGQDLTEQENRSLIEQTAQLKALKSERQQQERQLINLNKSLNAQNQSYNELTTAVNAAKARLKELPIDQTSEEFRQLQQFVAQGTAKLKDFDKTVGDNQRNVGNYPTTFNLATASIRDMEAEIVRLKNVAADLDINSDEFKNTTIAAQELETAVLKATGKIDEFGNREPKNATKKALDDATDAAAGAVAAIQLVTLALGDEETAEKATAAATKASAIATNFMLLLKAKEALVDTAAVAIKRIKIFLFGEELAATTALNTQTVLYALYQKLAAAATSVATAASTAFGVSIGVATGGLTILTGLLATAAATFFSFGASAANSQSKLSTSTDESNQKLKEQQGLIDGLSGATKEIKVELKAEGIVKDMAKLNLEREKAMKDFEDKANEAIGATLRKQMDLEGKAGDEARRLREEAVDEELKLRTEKNQGLIDLENLYNQKEEDLRKEYFNKQKEEEKKKLDKQKEVNEKRVEEEKKTQEKINKEFQDRAEEIQKAYEKEREQVAKTAAMQVGFENQRKAEEKNFYELAQKLRVDDTQLYFEYLEGNYKDFAEFEAKKLAAQQAFDKDNAERAAERTSKEKEQFEINEQAKQAAVDATFKIIQAGLDLLNQMQQQQYQSDIEAIDAKTAKEQAAIDNSNKSDVEKAKLTTALKKKSEKEKYEIELKAFKANQQFQAVQTVIATARAVVEAMANKFPLNLVLAASAGIMGGIQLAAILAAKPPAPPAFAKGGLIQGSGSGTSDSVPILASNGESVMTARATSMFAPILSAINVAGGGRAFASGGIVSPSTFNQLSAMQQQGNSFDVINGRIDRMKVYQVESDVSRSQLKVSTIESEATW
jgi:hypothetical protein